MQALYVVGGEEKKTLVPSATNRQYERGVVLSIDASHSRIERVVVYRSPPEVMAGKDAYCLFKAGTLAGEELFVCTETEIMSYSVEDWTPLMRLSLPCFNDVHH